MRGHGTKFGRKKEEAIAALLSHRSIDEAARAIGINANTLLRWLEIPEFGEAYRKARREAVHQAVARLQQATGAAGVTVLKLMTDPNVPAAVRLRAAECVFAHALKGIELEDVEARLAELERAADENKPGWRKK
jgi:transposase-like protein